MRCGAACCSSAWMSPCSPSCGPRAQWARRQRSWCVECVCGMAKLPLWPTCVEHGRLNAVALMLLHHCNVPDAVTRAHCSDEVSARTWCLPDAFAQEAIVQTQLPDRRGVSDVVAHRRGVSDAVAHIVQTRCLRCSRPQSRRLIHRRSDAVAHKHVSSEAIALMPSLSCGCAGGRSDAVAADALTFSTG